MLYRRLEALVDPLDEKRTDMPPESVTGFFLFFLMPMRGLLAFTLLMAGIAAVSELFLYKFVGDIVDLMNESGPDAFLERNGALLAMMTVVVAVIRPAATIISRGLVNLSLSPGITNSVRWQNYRYVLRQSLFPYQLCQVVHLSAGRVGG